jgi:hypothetical protein
MRAITGKRESSFLRIIDLEQQLGKGNSEKCLKSLQGFSKVKLPYFFETGKCVEKSILN